MTLLSRRHVPTEIPVFKYGRLAPKPVDVGDLTHYLTDALPAAPGTVDGPLLPYPMALNNTLEDCTVAGAVHVDQVAAYLTQQDWTYPGDPAVQAEFFNLTGGKNIGLIETNVLQAWMAPGGLFGNQLAAFAPINIRHIPVIRQTTWLCGAVYAGVLISQTQQTQFAQNKTWRLTGSASDSMILGGHAVPIVGYNAIGPIIVTWGQLVQCTWEWWLTYAEEAYAVITAEIRASGRLRQVAFDVLQRDLALLKAE